MSTNNVVTPQPTFQSQQAYNQPIRDIWVKSTPVTFGQARETVQIGPYHFFKFNDLPHQTLPRDIEEKARVFDEEYIRGFIAQPHPDKYADGESQRNGESVCPFVPIALKRDTMWMAIDPIEHPTIETITEKIAPLKRQFSHLENGRRQVLTTAIILFPNVTTEEAIAVLERVQNNEYNAFVKRDITLGTFHPRRERGGLHNPLFMPNRPPENACPAFIIRHVLTTDEKGFLKDRPGAVEALHEATMRRLPGQRNDGKTLADIQRAEQT